MPVMRQMKYLALIALVIVGAGLPQVSHADNMRRAISIAPHRQAAINPVLPDGMRLVESAQTIDRNLVSRDDVRGALEVLFHAWNTPNLSQYLARDFRQASRLIALFSGDVPISARLRLIALRSYTTLDARLIEDRAGEQMIMATVRATASSRIEYTNKTRGYRQLDGEGDYYLRLFYSPQQAK